MIYGYPNFQWIPENPINDGYENEDTIGVINDDEFEYIYSEGGQEEILLENEVEIHDTLEDEDAIK